jgi:hypothetical protein
MRDSSLRRRTGPARSWFGARGRLGSWILPFAGQGCQGAPPRAFIAIAMTAAALVALPFLSACASRGSPPAPTVPAPGEQAGTIRRVGTLGFAIVPDRDPGTRYVPDRPFPSEFEVDGLRVLFSGTETEPPEGARLWGTPFRLATLRRAGP